MNDFNGIIDFLKDNGIDFLENEPMKLHTTFRIGGNARIFVTAKTQEDVKKTVIFSRENAVALYTVGNGSNLLVSDRGIQGLVMRLCGEFEGIKMLDEETVEAGAGVSLASLCKFALSKELSGLEFAYGIPGTVGGAAFMNAGAYGGEMKDVVSVCRHIAPNGEVGSLCGEKLRFGYRKSAYGENNCIITSVIFRLNRGVGAQIKEKMDDFLERRRSKQPLDYPSAGSVFRRPEGYFAGALIEQSGLKGKRVGGAEVSQKHAGFIINTGNASCEDVKSLISICQNTVKDNFGVQLETEIKFI